ncbi:MAG TPA: hypothetical protein V6D10_15625 [Trichocoleus sp.]|jgi:hypothetical protein
MRVGPGAFGTFVYYFVLSAVILSISASFIFDRETGIPQQISVVGGVIIASISTYFNRTVITPFSISNGAEFLNQFKAILTASGYQQVEQIDEVSIFERSKQKWLSGKIFLRTEAEQATIAGRAAQVRRIRQQLEAAHLVQEV